MGTRARRERDKLRRRRAIVEAARGLFAEQGYAGTTMPQVAEAAELALGTLYLYFPSKSALYAELLMEGYDLLLSRLQTQIRPDATPRENAEALIDAFFQFAQDWPEYFDIIFFVLQSEGRPGGQSVLEAGQVERLQAKEAACKAVAAQVLEGPATNAPAANRQAMMDATWSMLVGVVFYFRKKGEEAFAAVAAQAKRLLLEALF